MLSERSCRSWVVRSVVFSVLVHSLIYSGSRAAFLAKTMVETGEGRTLSETPVGGVRGCHQLWTSVRNPLSFLAPKVAAAGIVTTPILDGSQLHPRLHRRNTALPTQMTLRLPSSACLTRSATSSDTQLVHEGSSFSGTLGPCPRFRFRPVLKISPLPLA